MTKITTKSGKEYFLIELNQEDFNAPKMDEIDYKNVFYTRYNAGVKIEFPPFITEQDKNDVKIEIGHIIFTDNNIAKLTPTQDEFQKVRDNYEKIGEYFAKNGFIMSWTRSGQINFKAQMPTIKSKLTLKVCVIILCKIMNKDYDFFVKNRVTLQSIYPKKLGIGWYGFAASFINNVTNLTDNRIKEFIDSKYEEIFE